MNLHEPWDVRPEKRSQLLDRIKRLKIDPEEIEEQFVRGSGPGGQKINKTAICVVLRYPPLSLQVRCQKDRRRSINRFLALRELVDRIEQVISPQTRPSLDREERKRQNRRRRKRRSRKKAQGSSPSEPPSSTQSPPSDPGNPLPDTELD